MRNIQWLIDGADLKKPCISIKWHSSHFVPCPLFAVLAAGVELIRLKDVVGI
jgi:hypothetical protein